MVAKGPIRREAYLEQFHILLGRILEEAPSAQDELFIKDNPTLFVSPGDPGWLDSTSIYIPDWAKLLNRGMVGLVREVESLGETDGRAADEGPVPGHEADLDGGGHQEEAHDQANQQGEVDFRMSQEDADKIVNYLATAYGTGK